MFESMQNKYNGFISQNIMSLKRIGLSLIMAILIGQLQILRAI